MQKWTIVVSSAVLAGSMVPAIHVPAIHAQANPNAIAYPGATGTQTDVLLKARRRAGTIPETASRQ